jgi:hypothetical protein
MVIGVENGDAGRELIECAAMCRDSAGKVFAQRLALGRVAANAGAAARHRHFQHLEGAPRAGDDDLSTHGKRSAASAATLALAVGSFVEEFALRLDRARRAICRDRRA